MAKRPPFIVSTADVPEVEGGPYPQSDEKLTFRRPIGKHAGMLRIGLHVLRLPPGRRTSWPHSEENEEEFVYVLEGEVDAWVDGELHRMKAGDLAAFPSGTGINHCLINNGTKDVMLFSGGERQKTDSRIYYPLNPSRQTDLAWSEWWHDVPKRPLGKHDGVPDKQRAASKPSADKQIAARASKRRG